MLSVENLSCWRGGRVVFEGLSFSLFRGACLMVRGANGSGKTSLLRLLAGLDPLQEGRVLWEGEPTSASAAFQAERQALWHDNRLKAAWTVEENLRFWAGFYDSVAVIPVATHLWGLQDVLDAPVGTLSQGWQRRVALARLLVSPGKIWLMDEPMANLDAEGIDMLERLIQSRIAQGGMVILSSHIELDVPGAAMVRVEDFRP
jgi:heme exporter protein A